jgi:Tetracyclin repressor-like, C-terminal domain
LIPRAMAHTEHAMALLDGLGLDLETRVHIAVTLANYVRGTAVNLEPELQAEQDSGLTSDEWMESQSATMAKIVSSGEFPMFSALFRLDLELSLDTLFEFGLGRLLDGLEMLVNRPREAPNADRKR